MYDGRTTIYKQKIKEVKGTYWIDDDPDNDEKHIN